MSVVAYITFAEELAALAAKTVSDIKGVVDGSQAKTVNDLLTDADAVYDAIISKAQSGGVPVVQAPAAPTPAPAAPAPATAAPAATTAAAAPEPAKT